MFPCVERSFSKQAGIQTRIRNRLTEDKVAKIMKIQFNSNYKVKKITRRNVDGKEGGKETNIEDSNEPMAISQTSIQVAEDDLMSDDQSDIDDDMDDD